MNNFELTGGRKSGVAFSAFTILYVIIAFLVQSIAGSALGGSSVAYRAVTAACSPLVICIVIGFFSVREKRSPLKIARVNKFNPIYILPALFLSAGMLFGLGFLNDLIAKAFSLKSTPVVMNDVGDLITYIIVLGVLPAVFEESLFRGIIVEGLSGVKTYLAVILTAVAFALFHGSLSQFFYQMIYGGLLTLLAIKSRSSVPSIIAHFINNLTVILLEYFKVNIDFYNWLIITAGLVAVLGVTAFLIFYKREKQDASESKKQTISFLIFSSVGAVICLALIVGGLLV